VNILKNTVLISGSGGQGVVSAGIILAESVAESASGTCLPEYGPEQRGGAAKCSVVISDGEIISPLPGKYMNFIAMNEQSHKKYIKQIKDGGLRVFNSNRITGIPADDKTILVPADDIAAEAGNPKTANIAMLGAFIKATGIVSEDNFVKTLKKKFAGKSAEILDMNIFAFKKGLNL